MQEHSLGEMELYSELVNIAGEIDEKRVCVCVILVIDYSCHNYGQDADGTGIYIS